MRKPRHVPPELGMDLPPELPAPESARAADGTERSEGAGERTG